MSLDNPASIFGRGPVRKFSSAPELPLQIQPPSVVVRPYLESNSRHGVATSALRLELPHSRQRVGEVVRRATLASAAKPQYFRRPAIASARRALEGRNHLCEQGRNVAVHIENPLF